MTTVAFQISQELKKFDQLNDLQALEAASDAVNAMSVSNDTRSSDVEKFHSEKLVLWLHVLNAIDAKIDPEFDINDTPDLSATPPPGAQIPPGANPSSIKDAEMRQKYIESIKLNSDKAARYSFQYKLGKLNDQITSDATIYIIRSHVKDPERRQRYLQTVDHLSTSSARKVSLQRLAQ